MMRKRLRRKRRSCALCKPQKRGWESRWSPKETEALERAERKIQAAVRNQRTPHDVRADL